MHLTKTFTKKIEEFRQALLGTREGIQTAGNILVEMLTENENTFEIILGQCRGEGVTLAMLECLERVGRHELNPFFLVDQSPLSERVISECLTVKAQEEMLAPGSTVPLVVKRGDALVVEQVSPSEIRTRAQAELVVGNGKIRTPDEQMQVIKDREAAKAVRSLRFELFPGLNKVKFHHDSEFTWAELEEICNKIAPKPVDIEASVKRNQIAKG